MEVFWINRINILLVFLVILTFTMSSVCAEDINNETYLSANDNEVNINNIQVPTSDLSNFSSNNKSNISYAQGN